MKDKSVYINGEKSPYFITDSGDVYRIFSNKKKYLKHFIDRDGYHRVTLTVNGKKYCRIVSRLVAISYIPNPNNKPEVNHINGDKNCNSYKNLEWVTTKENIDHAWKHNLCTPKYCESHPNSVYKNSQIRNVCKMLEYGDIPMKIISDLTDVSYTVVKQIKAGVIWTSISKDYDFSKYKDQRRYQH